VHLGEIAKKITDGEHQNPTITAVGKNLIMAKDVLSNKIDFSTPRFVSEENYLKYSKKCNPEFGDIVLVSRGATVGRCTIVNTTQKFCLMGSVILIKKGDNFESEYLCQLLKDDRFKKSLTNVSSASAQQAIYISHLKKLTIPLPPMELQKEFQNRMELVKKQRALAEEALQKSEILFQSLLQKAFNGELSFADAEAETA
jgi:type I restriction enzyme S subunit